MDLIKNVPLVGALLLLVTVNFTLVAFDPIKQIDADSLPAIRSWVWWATNDYKHQPKAPDVVLVGSSVMMHPTWWQEAAYRNQDVDLVIDHRSHYLEDIIKKHSGLNDVSCFNFGLPGAMASDDCIIAKSLFVGDRAPKIAVIGTCPRDFVDSKFSHAASSRHFRYLSRFIDANKLLALSMPHIWQRTDHYIDTLVYFKGKSQAIQQLLTHEETDAMEPFLRTLPPSPLEQVTDEDRKFAMHRAEIQKGVFVAHPTTPYHYVDEVEDCLRRYKTSSDETYENQKQWLELCLKTLKERNIECVLVNMPVTSTAQRCMRPGAYDRHVKTLSTLASKYDASFLNAHDEYQKVFDPEDFTDWAHMDASGGAKLHEIIGSYIASKQRLVAKLADRSSNIAAKSGNQL